MKKNEENEEKIEQSQTLDLSFFIGKSYFSNDGSESFLIFQPILNALQCQLVLQKQS